MEETYIYTIIIVLLIYLLSFFSVKTAENSGDC